MAGRIHFYNKIALIVIMVLSAALEDILKDAIEKEDEAFMSYSKLSEKTLKSNIKWFLRSFAEARKQMRDQLTKILEEKVDQDFGSPEENILHIQATEHLSFSGEVDLNSLQSVLLYVSKTESSELSNFSQMMDGIPEGKVKKLLGQILAEKEKVTIKADTLYHDMIET